MDFQGNRKYHWIHSVRSTYQVLSSIFWCNFALLVYNQTLLFSKTFRNTTPWNLNEKWVVSSVSSRMRLLSLCVYNFFFSFQSKTLVKRMSIRHLTFPHKHANNSIATRNQRIMKSSIHLNTVVLNPAQVISLLVFWRRINVVLLKMVQLLLKYPIGIFPLRLQIEKCDRF